MGTKLEVVVHRMKTGGIDVGCLSKTNVAWEREKVRRATLKIVKRGLERSARLVTVTSKVNQGVHTNPVAME